ncbi:MAG: hypothetical protein PHU27_11825 [Salinivirgaceae bacterium]|nr:hypothetical protein [Salinivirgaceae bacterium]MDD4747921.1 hypothetical protein [Salinivirgaceae bacterium]
MKKLTKEQFVNETLAIYTHVFHEMNTMLDKYPKIAKEYGIE